MSDDRNGSIGWFLAGLGLGAIVGLLYAPKSGRETREELLDRLEDGRDYVKKRGEDARDRATEWVDKGKEAVGRHKESISSAIDAGRQAYRESVGDKK